MRLRRLAQILFLSVVSVLAVTGSDVETICNYLSHSTVYDDISQSQNLYNWNDQLTQVIDIPKYKNGAWRDYWKVVPARGTAPAVDVPAMWGGSFADKVNLKGIRLGDGGWIGKTAWTQASADPKLTVVDLSTGGHTLNGSIAIAGYNIQKVTLTADGAVYLGELATATSSSPGINGGVPVLLPFGNKLKAVAGVSAMRSGWAHANGRELNAANQLLNDYVFVAEWTNLEVIGQGVQISIQVLIWKDGFVQFLYRTMPNQSSVAKLIAAQPWVGFAAGGKSYLITNLHTLFTLGNKIDVWNENGMRAGWVAFNSSDKGATEPSVSIVGDINGKKTLDMFFCYPTAFHLIAWDYSRDMFSVGSHSQFEVEYQTPMLKDIAGKSVTSGLFSPIPWAFDEWRLNNGSNLTVDEMFPQQKLDNKQDAVFAFTQNLMPNGSTVQTGMFNGAQAQLGPEVMSWAFKISAQTLELSGNQYLVKQISEIGTTLPGLLSFKRISYINNDVRSVEILGKSADLNPLGLKASVSRKSNEDSPIPAMALTNLFETAPTSINVFNFYVESVQDANGGSVPVDVVFKSGALGFVTKQRNWNGNFTAVIKVVRKSDNVSSTIPVLVEVVPMDDAPVIFQGEQANQLPYHIAMYGQEASTPINIASTDLVWDDETPLTSLVWTPTLTGATPQPQIDYPLLNSNNQLKLFFGTNAPPSGIWNLSLKVTDPTSLSDTKPLTVHRFASTIEVIPNSQVLTQLSPTGEVLAQFRVLLPKNHDALELKELVMGVWYSDRDMNILDHSPLDIGTCKNAPDGVRVECPVSFRYEKNAMAENPHTGDQFKLNEIFVEQMSFYVSIDLKHRNDQVQILFPMTDMDFAGPVMEASVANTQFIADKNSFSQHVSFQLGSENLKSLSLSVIQTCSGLATQSTVHDPAANNSAWLAKGVKNTWIQENIPSFCSVEYKFLGTDAMGNQSTVTVNGNTPAGTNKVKVTLNGSFNSQVYAQLDYSGAKQTLRVGPGEAYLPILDGDHHIYLTSQDLVFHPNFHNFKVLRGVVYVNGATQGGLEYDVYPSLQYAGDIKPEVRQVPGTGDLVIRIATKPLAVGEVATNLHFIEPPNNYCDFGQGEFTASREYPEANQGATAFERWKFVVSRATIASKCSGLLGKNQLHFSHISLETSLNDILHRGLFEEVEYPNQTFAPVTFKEPEFTQEMGKSYVLYSSANGSDYIQVKQNPVAPAQKMIVQMVGGNPQETLVEEFSWTPVGWMEQGLSQKLGLLQAADWKMAIPQADKPGSYVVPGFDQEYKIPFIKPMYWPNSYASIRWAVKLPHLSKSLKYSVAVLVSSNDLVSATSMSIRGKLGNEQGQWVEQSVDGARWVSLGDLSGDRPGGVVDFTLEMASGNIRVYAFAIQQSGSIHLGQAGLTATLPSFSPTAWDRTFQLSKMQAGGSYTINVTLLDAFGNEAFYPSNGYIHTAAGNTRAGESFYQTDRYWNFSTAQDFIPKPNDPPSPPHYSQYFQWAYLNGASADLGTPHDLGEDNVDVTPPVISQFAKPNSALATTWGHDGLTDILLSSGSRLYKEIHWPPTGFLSSQEFRQPQAPIITLDAVSPHRVVGQVIIPHDGQLTSGFLTMTWSPGSLCHAQSFKNWEYGNVFTYQEDKGFRMVPTFRGSWRSSVSSGPLHHQWLDYAQQEGGEFYPSNGTEESLSLNSFPGSDVAGLAMAIRIPERNEDLNIPDGLKKYKLWIKPTKPGKVYWGIDGVVMNVLDASAGNQWISGDEISLAPGGIHTLNLWMKTPGFGVSRMALLPDGITDPEAAMPNGTNLPFSMVSDAGFQFEIDADDLASDTKHTFTAQAMDRFGNSNFSSKDITTPKVPAHLPKLLIKLPGMSENHVITTLRPGLIVEPDRSNFTGSLASGVGIEIELLDPSRKNQITKSEVRTGDVWTITPTADLLSTQNDPEYGPDHSYLLRVRLTEGTNVGDWTTLWFGVNNPADAQFLQGTTITLGETKVEILSATMETSGDPVNGPFNFRATAKVLFDDFSWWSASLSSDLPKHPMADPTLQLRWIGAEIHAEKVANVWNYSVLNGKGVFSAVRLDVNGTDVREAALFPVNYGRFVVDVNPHRLAYDPLDGKIHGETPVNLGSDEVPAAWIEDDLNQRSVIDELVLSSQGLESGFVAKGPEFLLKDVVKYVDAKDGFDLAGCNNLFEHNAQGQFSIKMTGQDQCGNCGPTLKFIPVHPGTSKKVQQPFAQVIQGSVTSWYGPVSDRVHPENGDYPLIPFQYEIAYDGWNMEWKAGTFHVASMNAQELDEQSSFEISNFLVRLPESFGPESPNNSGKAIDPNIGIPGFGNAFIKGEGQVNQGELHMRASTTMPKTTETGILWHSVGKFTNNSDMVRYGYSSKNGWTMNLNNLGFFTVQPTINAGTNQIDAELHLPVHEDNKDYTRSPWSSFSPKSISFEELEFDRNGTSRFATTQTALEAQDGELKITGLLDIKHPGSEYALKVEFPNNGKDAAIFRSAKGDMNLLEINPALQVVRAQGKSGEVVGAFVIPNAVGPQLGLHVLGSEGKNLEQLLLSAFKGYALLGVGGRIALQLDSALTTWKIAENQIFTGLAKQVMVRGDRTVIGLDAHVEGTNYVDGPRLMAGTSSASTQNPTARFQLRDLDIHFDAGASEFQLRSKAKVKFGESMKSVGLAQDEVTADEFMVSLGSSADATWQLCEFKTQSNAAPRTIGIVARPENSQGVVTLDQPEYVQIQTGLKPVGLSVGTLKNQVDVGFDSATVVISDKFPIEALRNMSLSIANLKISAPSTDVVSVGDAKANIVREVGNVDMFPGFGFTKAKLSVASYAQAVTDGKTNLTKSVPAFKLSFDKLSIMNEEVEFCGTSTRDLYVTWDGSIDASFCVTINPDKLPKLYGDDIKLAGSAGPDSKPELTVKLKMVDWKREDISADFNGAVWLNKQSEDEGIKKIAENFGTSSTSSGNWASIDASSTKLEINETSGFAISALDITGTLRTAAVPWDLHFAKLYFESLQMRVRDYKLFIESKGSLDPEIFDGNNVQFTLGVEGELDAKGIKDASFDLEVDKLLGFKFLDFELELEEPSFRETINNNLYYGFFPKSLRVIAKQKALLALLRSEKPVWFELKEPKIYFEPGKTTPEIKPGTFTLGPTEVFPSNDFHISPLGLDIKGTLDFSPAFNIKNPGIKISDLQIATPEVLGGFEIPATFDLLLNGRSPFIHPKDVKALRIPTPKIELADGVKGKGAVEWGNKAEGPKDANGKQDSYWYLTLEGSVSIPEVVENGEMILSLVRPDNVNRTGIEHGGISLTLSKASWIPLGTTGLYITGLAGDFYDGYGQPSLSKSCSVGKLPPGLKAQMLVYIQDETGGDMVDGELGIWAQLNALNFGVDGNADLLEGQAEASICAAISNGVFRSKAQFDMNQPLSVTGKFQLDIWSRKGKKNIAGSASAEVGIKKGSLIKTYFLKVPRKKKMFGGIKTNFGRFTNGKNGFTAGFKFWGKTWGVGFIGSKFKLGGVGKYKLASPDGNYALGKVTEDGTLNYTIGFATPATGFEAVTVLFAGNQFFLGDGIHAKGTSLPDNSDITMNVEAEGDEEDQQGAAAISFIPKAGATSVKLEVSGFPSGMEMEAMTMITLLEPTLVDNSMKADLDLELPIFDAELAGYIDRGSAKAIYFQDVEPVILYRRSYRITPNGTTMTVSVSHTANTPATLDALEPEPMDSMPEEQWNALKARDFVSSLSDVESGIVSLNEDVLENLRMEQLKCVTVSGNTLSMSKCKLNRPPMGNGIYEFALGYKYRRYQNLDADPYDDAYDDKVDDEDVSEFISEKAIPFAPLADATKNIGYEAKIVRPKVNAKAVNNLNASASRWTSNNWNNEPENRLVMLNWDNTNENMLGLVYRLRYWANDLGLPADSIANSVYFSNTDHYDLQIPGMLPAISSSSSSSGSSSSALIEKMNVDLSAFSSGSMALRNMKRILESKNYTLELTPMELAHTEDLSRPGVAKALYRELLDPATQGSLRTTVNVVLEPSSSSSVFNKITSIEVAGISSSSGVPIIKVPINKRGKFSLNVGLANPGAGTIGNSDSYADLLSQMDGSISAPNFADIIDEPKIMAQQQQIAYDGGTAAKVDFIVNIPRKNETCQDRYRPRPVYLKNASGQVVFDNLGNPIPLTRGKATFGGTADTLACNWDPSTETCNADESSANDKQLAPEGAWTTNRMDTATVFHANPCRFGELVNRSQVDIQRIPVIGTFYYDIALLNRGMRTAPQAPTQTGVASAVQRVGIQVMPPEVRIENVEPGYIVYGRDLDLYFEIGKEHKIPGHTLVTKLEFVKRVSGQADVVVDTVSIPLDTALHRMNGRSSFPKGFEAKEIRVLQSMIRLKYFGKFVDGDTVWIRINSKATSTNGTTEISRGNEIPMVFVLKVDDFECPVKRPDSLNLWKHVSNGLGFAKKAFTDDGMIHFSEVLVDSGMVAEIHFVDDETKTDTIKIKDGVDGAFVRFTPEGISYDLGNKATQFIQDHWYDVFFKQMGGAVQVESNCDDKKIARGYYSIAKSVKIIFKQGIDPKSQPATKYWVTAVGGAQDIWVASAANLQAARISPDLHSMRSADSAWLYQPTKLFAFATTRGIHGVPTAELMDSIFIPVVPHIGLKNSADKSVVKNVTNAETLQIGDQAQLDLKDANGQEWKLNPGIKATFLCKHSPSGPEFSCFDPFYLSPEATGTLYVTVQYEYEWGDQTMFYPAVTIPIEYNYSSTQSLFASLSLTGNLCRALQGIEGTLHNYPLLIQLGANDLSKDEDWVALESGFVFRDSKGRILETDLDYFSKDAKSLIAWVRIPELNAAECPEIRISAASAMPQANAKAYPAAIGGAWHFTEGNLIAANNSTFALNQLGWTIGRSAILAHGLSRELDGVGPLNLPSVYSGETDPGFAFSTWLKVQASQMPNTGWDLLKTADEGIHLRVERDLSLTLQVGAQMWGSAAGVYALNRWSHVSLSLDLAEGLVDLRIDGHPVDLHGSRSTMIRNEFRHALSQTATGLLFGPLDDAKVEADEVRLYRTAISPLWNRADYRTQRQYMVDRHLQESSKNRTAEDLQLRDGKCAELDVLPGAQVGDPLYRDRGFQVLNLPESMLGGTWIHLGQGDREGVQACIGSQRNAKLYVLVDTDYGSEYPWLEKAMLMKETVHANLTERLLNMESSSSSSEAWDIDHLDPMTADVAQEYRVYQLDLGTSRIRIPQTLSKFNYGLLIKTDSKPECAKVSGSEIELQKGISVGTLPYRDADWNVRSLTTGLQSLTLVRRNANAPVSVYEGIQLCRISNIYLMVAQQYAAALQSDARFQLVEESIELQSDVKAESRRFTVFHHTMEAGSILDALPAGILSGIPKDAWMVAFHIPVSDPPSPIPDGVNVDQDGGSSKPGMYDPGLVDMSQIEITSAYKDAYLTLTFDGPVRVYVAHAQDMKPLSDKLKAEQWTRQKNRTWKPLGEANMLVWQKEYLDELENIVLVPTPRLVGIDDNDGFVVFYERLSRPVLGYQLGTMKVAAIPGDKVKSSHFQMQSLDFRPAAGSASSPSWKLNLQGNLAAATYKPRSVLSVAGAPSPLVVLENGQEVFTGSIVKLADVGLSGFNSSNVTVQAIDRSARGYVEISVQNQGNTTVTEGFWIQLFDDMNQDYQYSLGTDQSLGGAVVSDLKPGETRSLHIPVNGKLAYPERAIFAFADPQMVLPDPDLTNNLAYIPGSCVFASPDYEQSFNGLYKVWDTDANGVVNGNDEPVKVTFESNVWKILNHADVVLASIPGEATKRILDLDHDGKPEWIFARNIRSSTGAMLWSADLALDGSSLGFDLDGNSYRELIQRQGSCLQIKDSHSNTTLYQDGVCNSQTFVLNLAQVQPGNPQACTDISLSGLQRAQGMPVGEIWWKVRVANSVGATTIPAGIRLIVKQGLNRREVLLNQELAPKQFLDLLIQGYTVDEDELRIELPAIWNGWVQETSLMNNSLKTSAEVQ